MGKFTKCSCFFLGGGGFSDLFQGALTAIFFVIFYSIYFKGGINRTNKLKKLSASVLGI